MYRNPRCADFLILTLASLASAQPPAESSLEHFRLGEAFLAQRNLQSAANEFREALNGDGNPPWTLVWSRIHLGRIFDQSGQRHRAIAELCAALRSDDNTRGAQSEAARYLYAMGVDAPHRPGNAESPDAAPLPPGNYRVEDKLEILERTDPEYPPEARAAGAEGRVLVSGTLGVDGRLHDARISRGAGLGLDAAALAAVSNWRFRPRSFDGRNVPTPATVPVDFTLPGRASRWHLMGFEATAGTTIRKTRFPSGAGISSAAMEHAQVVAVLRRLAAAVVSFEIESAGRPVNIVVESASHRLWEPEAASVVAEWEFEPPPANSVPAIGRVFLVWGPRQLTSSSLEKLVPGLMTVFGGPPAVAARTAGGRSCGTLGP